MKTNNTVWSYLFTPFRYVAGVRTLIAGVGVLLLLSLLGWLTHTFFDGVLDVHYGCLTNSNPYYVHIVMLLISWVSIVAVFYLAERIFSSSTVRLVDMAGTLALAKAPLILTALWGFVTFARPCFETAVNQEDVTSIMALFKDHWVWTVVAGIISVSIIIWSVALLYNAFTVSGNLRGTKGTVIFIVGLLISEAVSKILIYLIL